MTATPNRPVRRIALATLLLAAAGGFARAQDSEAPDEAALPDRLPLALAPGDAERLLGSTPDVDKSPRLAGDWCCWTSDRSALGSSGHVLLSRLSTGERFLLGDGCLPDLALLPDGDVRVAFLRFEPGGGIGVRSVLVPAAAPGGPHEVTDLAHGLAWADHVRACGEATAWSAPDADGRLKIWVQAGREPDGSASAPVAISDAGEAFRPELVRDARGVLHCAWDAYMPAPRLGIGVLDYEVFLAACKPNGRWSAPVNLSNAPLHADMAPSLAADADGCLWVAWQSDRDGHRFVACVEKRAADGSTLVPVAWPPDASEEEYLALETEDDAAPPARPLLPRDLRRGTVALRELRDARDPHIVLDGAGRPWLFVGGQPAGAAGARLYDKQLIGLVLDELGWSDPWLVSDGPRDEVALAAEPVPGDPFAIRVAYQLNSADTGGVEVALRTLRTEAWSPAKAGAADPDEGPCLELLPPIPPFPPQPTNLAPALPDERLTRHHGGQFRLFLADLHCHAGYSPDGVGERDAALFFARDVAGLDAVAITDHDARVRHPLTDWEYELGRREVALFDAPNFVAFMGFEWTNDVYREEGEIVGHRACFDSSCCYRYTDPDDSTLAALVAHLHAEDAIGVPHHLGKFGGTSLRHVDPQAQPVTEVCSAHGEYEDLLWRKLLDDHARTGVIAGGDVHVALPGTAGLAAIWVEQAGPPGETTLANSSPREALKAALRARRTYALRHDGLLFDATLDGAVPGEVLQRPAGDRQPLRLHVRLADLPWQALARGVNVNLVRDGDDGHPLWQSDEIHERDFARDVDLPALDAPACLMLRVTRGAGTAAAETLLWTSPIWIEEAPGLAEDGSR